MDSSRETFVVRELRKNECSQLMDMMYELADFIEERDEVINTEDGLLQDLFEEPKRCHCLVAEYPGGGANTSILVGYSLYFYAYSSWIRSYVFMEDLFVREKYRGKGIGKSLYRAVVQIALDKGCQQLELTVLMRNEKAKVFYASVGMIDQTEADGRHKMRLTRGQMENVVKSGAL